MIGLFWRRLSLPLSVVALLFFAGSQSAVSVSPKTTVAAYHDTWRVLWEDHISWTRSVIIGVFHLNTEPLSGADPYTNRLLKNYEDMQDALAPYYGEDAEVLGDLIKDHLVIAAQILVGLRAGDDVSGFITAWYANGHDIAVKMAEMNPKYWPFSHGESHWLTHLDATVQEVLAHAGPTPNFAADVQAYDLIHELALHMADFFSDGVVGQFPGRFTRVP